MKYYKKRYRLVRDFQENLFKELIIDNVVFTLRNTGFTTIYKEEEVMYYDYTGSEDWTLSLYIYIDYIDLKVNNTKFEYALFNEIVDFHIRKSIPYSTLNGKNLKDKVISLSNLIRTEFSEPSMHFH